MLAVAPGVAGASIEQDADGCEIDGDTRMLDEVGLEMRREFVPTVDAAGREVPPAAVIGDREIGIRRAGHVGDIVRDGTESVLFEGEMRGAPVDNPAAD